MEDKKYEVAERNSGAIVGLSPLVQAAMSGQLDTQKLSELLAIQKEYEANEARKAYYYALSEFKRHPLTIYKNKQVKFTSTKGTTEYKHATLGAALEEINPLLGKCELSLTWDVCQPDNGTVKVTAILSHSMGHREMTSLSASPDNSGNKNNIQMVGSTIEYLKRYTAFPLLGISSKDMDDDGTKVEVQYISEEQQNELHSMITDNMADGYLSTFLSYTEKQGWGASLDQIGAKNYGRVKAALNSAIKKRKEAGK